MFDLFFFGCLFLTSPVSLLHHFRLLDDKPPFLVALGLLKGLLVLPSEDGGAAFRLRFRKKTKTGRGQSRGKREKKKALRKKEQRSTKNVLTCAGDVCDRVESRDEQPLLARAELDVDTEKKRREKERSEREFSGFFSFESEAF